MIYEQPDAGEVLSQGDIIDACPILFWEYPASGAEGQPQSASTRVRALVLTQACDLAQAKATRVLVAVRPDRTQDCHPVRRPVVWPADLSALALGR